MEIITRDGKDYLKTKSIFKVNSGMIECSEFFEELKEAKKEILKMDGKDENSEISYGAYGSNIQTLLKRFSNTYFSPSFMKGFMDNPANVLIGSFAQAKVNDATEIGTVVHKIFELYYKQDKNKREQSQLLDLMKENLLEGQDEETVRKYIEGYLGIPDYLDRSIPLDDKKLDCFCEYRGKCNIVIPKFNLTVDLPVSYVVDRIDVRKDKLYIIDYKTGYQPLKSASFSGYLGSMILYKWVVEQDFGMEVAGGYLCTPGNQEKYIDLDFSLVNESKLYDMVNEFCKGFASCTESRQYPFTDKGYFTNDDLKRFRQEMNEDDEPRYLEFEIYLGEHRKEKKKKDATV